MCADPSPLIMGIGIISLWPHIWHTGMQLEIHHRFSIPHPTSLHPKRHKPRSTHDKWLDEYFSVWWSYVYMYAIVLLVYSRINDFLPCQQYILYDYLHCIYVVCSGYQRHQHYVLYKYISCIYVVCTPKATCPVSTKFYQHNIWASLLIRKRSAVKNI